MEKSIKLKMLPLSWYKAGPDDPIRFYNLPFIGSMYRRRVELCLERCTGGQRVLEVGYGSGVAFPNLDEMYQEIHGIDLCAPAEELMERFRQQNITTDLREGDILDAPYEDDFFDTVLLVSILEHLRPEQQSSLCRQIQRILKPGGQMIYGVPVERQLMVWMYRCLGHRIRDHHFSTEQDVRRAAGTIFEEVEVLGMRSNPPLLGTIYEVGHFVKRIRKPSYLVNETE